MVGYIIHLATVTVLALGVVPLGMFIVWGGLHDLKDAKTVRSVLGALAFTALGTAVVVLPLILFVDGVAR